MNEYRKKPVVIEARRVTAETMEDVARWCRGEIIQGITNSFLQVKTLEGYMAATDGDYMIRGVKGEFYPCKPDVFEETYEEVGHTESRDYVLARLLQKAEDTIPQIRMSDYTEGYSVEIDGQRFTEAQWNAVQAYAGEAIKMAQQGAEESEAEEARDALVTRRAEGLEYMLELQREVESGWGRLPDTNDPEHVSRYIREVVLCATDELHEVLGEVHWKPWKDKRGIRDIRAYREELADVMHFILDLYLAAGLTGEDILIDYMAKHHENIDRTTRDSYKAS